ncbi:winged helix-turn-helix domain-containing protein [Haloferax sp. S1W]|uniref:winged helix-turn-helix domain-containing protein n=1 Tax=Haloferax sp. S1W TaxID=3377110 RepID=UPI0037C9FDB0
MSGRKRTVSDEEILEVLLDSEDPFLTTTEVAEVLDFSQPGALKRLRQLEEKAYVETKKAGNSNTWWITESGRERVRSK